MTTLETVRVLIALVALGCGVVAFGIYVAASLGRLKTDAGGNVQAATAKLQLAQAVSAGEATGLVEALAKLADSLAKAGPALWSLLGSALFLLIAAISAGVLVGGGQDAAAPQSAPGSQAHQAAAAPPVNENLPVK